MINFNGELLPKKTAFLDHGNRALRYGDSLFETLRAIPGKVCFWEEHYLRLMASMRILRMEIPMAFTMEFLEEELLKTIRANDLEHKASRLRLTIFRNSGGLYLPLTNNVSFIVEVQALSSDFFVLDDTKYEVELFKDFYVNPDMLSTLKTNNRALNVVASVFAQENDYNNCLLLNTAKQVVEAINGNVFMVFENTIKTPPLKDGCINGIIRQKLIHLINKSENYKLEEVSISPFELQKAKEIFITNAVIGIRTITKYRKKEFENSVAQNLIGKLNAAARLG